MKVWLRDSVKVGVKFYKIPQVHQVLFRYIPEVTGQKLSFTRSRRHDEPEEPIKSTQTLQIPLRLQEESASPALNVRKKKITEKEED